MSNKIHRDLQFSLTVPSALKVVLACGWWKQLSQYKQARWLYYNVYTVPWRGFEVFDILTKYFSSFPQDKPIKSILDMGCGFGGILCYLKFSFRATKCIGIDEDDQVVEAAKAYISSNKIKDVSILAGDLARAAADFHGYDLIISYDALYGKSVHRGEALKAAFNALDQNGVLFIKVINRMFPPYWIFLSPAFNWLRLWLGKIFPELGGRLGQREINAPASFRFFREVKAAGFTDVAIFNRITRRPIGLIRWFAPDFILVAKKPKKV